MPVKKAVVAAKKAPVKAMVKKTPAKKTAAKSRASGDTYACEVCGLAVVVEEVGGMTISEESVLLCCSKPMKQKKAKAKVRTAR